MFGLILSLVAVFVLGRLVFSVMRDPGVRKRVSDVADDPGFHAAIEWIERVKTVITAGIFCVGILVAGLLVVSSAAPGVDDGDITGAAVIGLPVAMLLFVPLYRAVTVHRWIRCLVEILDALMILAGLVLFALHDSGYLEGLLDWLRNANT